MYLLVYVLSFPGGSDIKSSACNVGDPALIPELGRSPGVGNGNPLQYSWLENPMDRGAWQAAIREVTKSRAQGNYRFTCSYKKKYREVSLYFTQFPPIVTSIAKL